MCQEPVSSDKMRFTWHFNPKSSIADGVHPVVHLPSPEINHPSIVSCESCEVSFKIDVHLL